MRRRFFLFSAALSFAPFLTAQPQIYYRGIVNAASFVPAGLPGGSIARGSIFSIFGANLGPATSPALAFPLGTALGGVSIKVNGSTSADAIPLYVSATQINAIMPSTAPLGTATVVVTYNNRAGNPSPVQIVNSTFGISSANGSGNGPGIAVNFNTQADQPVNSPAVAAKPGQTITLWGTGLGPVSYADNIAPTPVSLATQTEVFVGGKSATIAYNGRSPCCAGDDQIVFTVPPDAPTGCWVPVQVRTEGTIVSNTVTMAISSDGSPCSDPANPYAQEILAGGKIGQIDLRRTLASYTIVSSPPTDITVDQATPAFVQVAPGPFPFNAALSLPPPGSCTVIARSGDFLSQTYPNFFITSALNAGPAVVFSGSKGIRTVNLPPSHWNQLGKNIPGGTLTNTVFLEPGAISFSGAGGADVGAFKGSITNPSAISWTNRSQISTVNRTQPLTVNWSGAGPGQLVEITGTSSDLTTNGSARFICVATAGASSFSVPTVILESLPATRTSGNVLKGALAVGAIGATTAFTASGLDFGIASVSAFTSQPVIYQ
jgi:uncharacterized protein (TIGR03437 family)